jgi:RNA polymerase sigma factor (sigma-70 family)
MPITEPKYDWQAFCAGDRLVFEQVYRTHARGLYAYAVRLCGDNNLATDCVQDVFVKIWNLRAQLTNVHQPGAYLLRTLRNALLRQLEQKKRQIPTDEADLLRFDMQETGVDTKIMALETDSLQAEWLQKAMAQLSPRQHEAVYLRYWEGLDYTSIAEIMNVEQQSAYNLVFRGIETLRAVQKKAL